MSNFCTFVFYLIVILSATLMSYFAYSKKYYRYKIFFILAAVFILGLVAGIRYKVGSDWLQYFNGPKLIGEGQYLRAYDKGSYEIGYIILCKVVYLLGYDGTLLLFIYGFLTYLFFFLTIDRYSNLINIPITVFMYGCLYYLVSFNITRQALSINIAMYAISYLDIGHIGDFRLGNIYNNVKHNLKFLILGLVAILFHNASVICFLAFPICLIMRRKNIIRWISIAIIIYFVANFKLFTQLAIDFTGSSSFQWYFIAQEGEKGSWIFYIIRYLPMLLIFLISYKNILRYDKIFNVYNLTLVGLIINGLSVVTSTEIERIGFPFLYFITIMTGFAFKHSESKLDFGNFYISIPTLFIHGLKIFLCMFFIWTMWYIFFKTGAYQVVPYHTVFGI